MSENKILTLNWCGYFLFCFVFVSGRKLRSINHTSTRWFRILNGWDERNLDSRTFNCVSVVQEWNVWTVCLQLEETQAKRHDQLVEQHNELLQEIQDQKPKVKSMFSEFIIGEMQHFVLAFKQCNTNPVRSIKSSHILKSCSQEWLKWYMKTKNADNLLSCQHKMIQCYLKCLISRWLSGACSAVWTEESSFSISRCFMVTRKVKYNGIKWD